MIFRDLREIVDEIPLVGSQAIVQTGCRGSRYAAACSQPAWRHTLNDPATIHHGRLVIFLRHLHDPGQHGGAGAAGGRLR